MAFFTIYNATGKILRTGTCPADEVSAQCHGVGEFLVEEFANPEDSVDCQTGLIVDAPPPPPAPTPVPQYIIDRSNAYPAVQVQLDMLWKAMDSGLLPKVPEFYERIKAVKLAFPKAGKTPPTIIHPVEPLP